MGSQRSMFLQTRLPAQRAVGLQSPSDGDPPPFKELGGIELDASTIVRVVSILLILS